ncbi:GNAT family N-acetyltransferase [Terrilactibacillus sp. BCM23-1]|uniref:GNAT family N-acetyltransferase n=1 Tax=Terrilactibacillus tamarindi TaxID=2599694 RepID=A0A6N8CQG7_9BACI|nr:GNAT family N-acetyltransferase [Terrilactibacillus tamarindi]MTT31417.1 GNAT family N-acetyltransferase [Terrilactibacillus tamarindi]
MVKLETERLYLQPFKKLDSSRIQELANNKEVANILGLPHPYLLKYAEDWIDTHPELIKKGVEYPLAIVYKNTKEIIGTINIRVDHNNNKGELGYWIGRDYWGNGFATEAVKQIISFGFNELNLNKIWAAAISRNKASIMVLEKAGLQKEGTLRQNKLLLNNYEDVEVYGLLKVEFTKQDSCK